MCYIYAATINNIIVVASYEVVRMTMMRLVLAVVVLTDSCICEKLPIRHHQPSSFARQRQTGTDIPVFSRRTIVQADYEVPKPYSWYFAVSEAIETNP